MPLFKVGDVIESVYSGAPQEVIGINSVYYTLKSLNNGLTWGETISFIDNLYVLSNTLSKPQQSYSGNNLPIQPTNSPFIPPAYNTQGMIGNATGMSNSKFSMGNKVITQWNNELEITAVDFLNQIYYYRIIKSNNPMKTGTTDKESFNNAHVNWKLKQQELKPIEKQCTCDSRILFNKGCICGAIKPYRSRLG